jgi:hypothetical protein
VTFSGLDLIPAGDYEYTSLSFSYSSDVRKKWNGSASFQHGSYYNWTRSTVCGNLSFRKQPWGIFGMAFSQNSIELPEPFEGATITLVGPKIELSFTKPSFGPRSCNTIRRPTISTSTPGFSGVCARCLISILCTQTTTTRSTLQSQTELWC